VFETTLNNVTLRCNNFAANGNVLEISTWNTDDNNRSLIADGGNDGNDDARFGRSARTSDGANALRAITSLSANAFRLNERRIICQF